MMRWFEQYHKKCQQIKKKTTTPMLKWSGYDEKCKPEIKCTQMRYFVSVEKNALCAMRPNAFNERFARSLEHIQF